MSHTTPAIAIAELQGQLADAKTEVADSLSYLTDCRTTVAASSFATHCACACANIFNTYGGVPLAPFPNPVAYMASLWPQMPVPTPNDPAAGSFSKHQMGPPKANYSNSMF